MRATVLLSLLILSRVLNTLSFWYIHQTMPVESINPLINTQSLLTMFLSPGPVLMDMLCVTCIVLAERNAHRFDALMEGRILRVLIFFFPMNFLFNLTLATANNIAGVNGLGTPLGTYGTIFSNLTTNAILQHTLANTVIALLMLPVFIAVARRLYSSAWSAQQISQKPDSEQTPSA